MNKPRGRGWRRGILIGILKVCLFTLIFSVAHAKHHRPNILNRDNSAEPATLDLARAQGSVEANILSDLYEGLVAQSPSGSLIPGLATHWEISENGRIYTFHLRKDAKWSNGEPLVAADFVAGIRRVVDPKVASVYAHLISDIEHAEEVVAGQLPVQQLGVEAPDDHTVVYRLKYRSPYFLELLLHWVTFPIYQPALKKYGEAFTQPGRLVSNGPFFLKEWVIHSHVLIKRNPHYWDKEHVALDGVRFLPIENRSSVLDRYRVGEVDITSTIPMPQLKWIKKNFGDELHNTPFAAVYWYAINLRKEPFKSHPKLREALNLAIDRHIITEKILGLGQKPSYKLVPTQISHAEAWTPIWATWTQKERDEAARRAYQEAGFSNKKPAKFALHFNTDQEHKRIAVALASMWKKTLGVQVELVNHEWKVFLSERQLGNLEIFRGSWIADYNDPMAFLYLFVSGNNQSSTGYKNPAFDDLLARSNQANDLQERAHLLKQAEELLLQELPVLPIYDYVTGHLVKPYVKGFHVNLMDRIYSKHLSIER